jgi:tRNA(Ile)-lysidine synthase
VDHGIRGESSRRDRDFCEALAKEEGLPFYLLETDVPALARQNHTGLEEEARAERYRFFEKIMREQGIPILATAHNATDNAETMLFRMARGTGLSGLCGISPARPFGNGMLIRPLLDLTKDEILAYCDEHRLAYVTDETNADVTFARNRIRHKILPEMAELNEGAVRHMSELCRTLREDESFLADAAQAILDEEAEPDSIALPRLLSLPHALSGRTLALLFGEPPLSRTNREEILSLAARATPHSSIDLPGARSAKIENGRLFARFSKENSPPPLSPTPISLGVTELSDRNMRIVIDSETRPHESRMTAKNIYKNETTILINSDRIKDGLFLRSRTEGDVILFHGMHKKIRKLQNECALPLALRQSLPLLCDKDGVLWCPLVAARDGVSEDGDLRVTLFYSVGIG